MLLDKVWLVSLMAARAKRYHIISQQIFSLGGGMRIVAVDAFFLNWIMLEFCFCNGLSYIFVAIETEFIPRFQKDKFVFGGMGIVALYTIAFHHHFMTAFRIFRHDPFMALVADFVRIFVQQLSMGRGVRIMTFRAFSRLHRSVHKWIFELFFKVIVTVQAQLSLGIRFESEFILSVGK
jgi:hypothetical protein